MSATINSGFGFTMRRPMRSAPPDTIRPPNPGPAPLVASATGLGTGGGAGIGGNSDAAWGHVRLIVGPGAAASGNVSLQFPVATPAAQGGIVAFADWAVLVVTQGNPTSIVWTAPAALAPGKILRIAYEWQISQ